MPPNITLKHLASQLGLSVTTVSRALGGFEDVSATTRERVQAYASEVGYKPNQSARRLKTGRTSSVGYIMNGAQGDFRDQFNTRLLVALGQALHDAAPEHDLIVTTVPEDRDELDTYKRFIDGGKVDSFVVARTRIQDPRVDFLLDSGIPFVTHGRTGRASQHDWVDINAADGFMRATRHLIGLGHRNILFLNFFSDLYTAVERETGYLQAMHDAGLAPSSRHCPHGYASAYQVAQEALSGANAPTAFVCASDIFAYGVMEAVSACGHTPGEDIAIIGADNLPPQMYRQPSLSTLDISFETVSQALIELVLAPQEGAPRHRCFDYDLLLRDTTA
ncbi:MULTISPECIES: substrate-binding domain-containing protein [unclassified Cobetia]|uniref:substrate-binding domain-containing protein n=1 Tax=unclassified Cobetia TaxID=2609414 RepID=UPI00178CE21C|nr:MULTISPECIES: substrate-binding domain-containing protein [unclassified Cobetia]MBE2169250.1 substrate-binding domain-containing protein [Cobetia sp. 2AS1]MDH2446739.1 substrate-binding domain-containing protein [Cobetia sp. 2AS]